MSRSRYSNHLKDVFTVYHDVTEGGKAVSSKHIGDGGKKNMRRGKAGAKKFVRSRIRHHEKAELKNWRDVE